MNDDYTKSFVKGIFEFRKITVEEIPESNIESADLKVTIGEEISYIEIKSRLDDPEVVEAENIRLASGEIVTRSQTTGRTNNISSIAKKAASQLSQHDSQAFRILWFFGLGNDGKLQSDQCRATLYGISNVGERNTDNVEMKECYYFEHGDFYKLKDIVDGAAIGYLGANEVFHGGLNINNFSPKKKALVESKFAAIFGTAVCNPDELEAKGEIYIADCGFSRKDKVAMLGYVETKYKTGGLFNLTLESHEFVTQLTFGSKLRNVLEGE